LALSDSTVQGIRNAIEELKGAIAELETGLSNNPSDNGAASLKRIGLRLLVSADRVYSLLSRQRGKWR
jgi:hypothetical protein